MAPPRYESVIGLQKGHKVTKNNYQNRPCSRKGVRLTNQSVVCFTNHCLICRESPNTTNSFEVLSVKLLALLHTSVVVWSCCECRRISGH